MRVSLRFLRALFCAAALVCPVVAQTVPLPVKPIDVEYSPSLDRLILVAKNPNQLHIANPATGASVAVDLQAEPTAVSVSPDGKYAAVGHASKVSYVNLTAAAVEKVLTVSTTVSDLILAGNGWIYAFPSRSLHIATGVESITANLSSVGRAVLHPDGKSIYYYSSYTLGKIDISNGAMQSLHAVDAGSYNCGLWPTQESQRMLTGCSAFFRLTEDPATDLQPGGVLGTTAASGTFLAAAAHSPALKLFAVVPQYISPSTVHFYESQFLNHQGSIQTPVVPLSTYTYVARFVYFDSAGSKLYLVMEPPSPASSSPWAVQAVPMSSGPACGASASTTTASASSDGQELRVNVTATAGCVWRTVSNASWLSVGAGGVGFGTGTVQIVAARNLTTTPRSGTVTIAGQTYTVTQAAASTVGGEPLVFLPARPVAAEYSTALDRLVYASASPNVLHLYDPVTRADETIALALPPTSLSLSLNGLYAAVGHKNLVSYVNLSTKTVERNLSVSLSVFRLALSGTHVYAFPGNSNERASVVNIATGAETIWGYTYGSSAYGGRISPDGRKLYVNGEYQFDLSMPVPANPYGYSYGNCYDMWITEDSRRLFSSCGAIKRLSDIPGQEVQAAGTLFDNGVRTVAHSSLRGLVAAVKSNPYNGTGVDDATVQFFYDGSLAAMGAASIPKIEAGTAAIVAHGRHAFWNKHASRLFVVAQADQQAGLANDFAIQTIDLTQSCGVTLGSASASAGAGGGAGTLSVSGTAGCVWHAQSDSSWVTISQNGIGSGAANVAYIVDANLTVSVRTAKISVAGQTLTITQAAGSPAAAAPTHVLPFRVVDAEYSYALDRIVSVSANPNVLRIYDAANRTSTDIALSAPPTTLSLSPDGLRAAAGHDALITIYNLQTGVLEKNLTVAGNVADIALGGNDWVYARVKDGTHLSIRIATGQQINDGFSGTDFVNVSPIGTSLYRSRSDGYYMYRFSIADGGAKFLYESPYSNQVSRCGPVWFTTDVRILSSCGAVLRSSDVKEQDMASLGNLSGIAYGIAGASHSAARRTIAVLPKPSSSAPQAAGQVTLHDDEYYALNGKLTLPTFPAPGTTIPSQGRFVFWNKAGTRVYVIMQAASGALLDDYALHIVSPEFTSCSTALGTSSASIPGAGGTGSVAVNAASDCVWEAKSNVPWIAITYGFGAGLGNAAFRVDPNLTPATRTGTLTIDGKTFTVNQAAGDPGYCHASLSPNTISASATGGSGTISLSIGVGCPWSAASSIAWAQVTPTSGSGSADLQYTVSPNALGTARSGSLTIGGNSVAVAQLGTDCTAALSPAMQSVTASGGTFAVSVGIAAGCAWTAVANSTAISFSNASGTGAGTVTYTVTANTTALARTFTITIGGQTLTVNQSTSPCLYSLDTESQSVPGAGGTYRFVVTVAAGCPWTAVKTVGWLDFSILAGNQTTAIQYTVHTNPAASARTGAIQIGGKVLTITQAAAEAADCVPKVSDSTVNVSSAGASGVFTLTTGASCKWTASSSAPWVQVFPLNGTGPATIRYTVYPNHKTTTRGATLRVSAWGVSIAQLAALGSHNDRFVSLMYFNSLGRLASPAEIAFHSGNLSFMSRADTIMNFVNSEEFNRAGRFIAGLYVGLLGRDAEFDGWLFQRNAIVTGGTSQERLVPSFLGSPEFALKYGTLTDASFVQLLYRNIMGREASTAEVDFQKSVLQAGTTRQQMAQSFLNAAEFRVRSDKRLTAFLLYSILLLRSITPEELVWRVGQMEAGLTPKHLVESIIGTPEFAALLQ